MSDKYLYLDSGNIKEKEALNSSAGATDAGKIPALDSTGKLNSNMMPSGVSAAVQSVTADGDLSQYDIVNIYNNSGTLSARKADAGTNRYQAHAFCPAAISNGATGNVQMEGSITGSAMTPGADQFLSDTPGDYSETPPTGTGKIVQKVGYATSATTLYFTAGNYIQLA